MAKHKKIKTRGCHQEQLLKNNAVINLFISFIILHKSIHPQTLSFLAQCYDCIVHVTILEAEQIFCLSTQFQFPTRRYAILDSIAK